MITICRTLTIKHRASSVYMLQNGACRTEERLAPSKKEFSVKEPVRSAVGKFPQERLLHGAFT